MSRSSSLIVGCVLIAASATVKAQNCRTFEDIYVNASGLCNRLWGDAFVYTEDGTMILYISISLIFVAIITKITTHRISSVFHVVL